MAPPSSPRSGIPRTINIMEVKSSRSAMEQPSSPAGKMSRKKGVLSPCNSTTSCCTASTTTSLIQVLTMPKTKSNKDDDEIRRSIHQAVQQSMTTAAALAAADLWNEDDEDASLGNDDSDDGKSEESDINSQLEEELEEETEDELEKELEKEFKKELEEVTVPLREREDNKGRTGLRSSLRCKLQPSDGLVSSKASSSLRSDYLQMAAATRAALPSRDVALREIAKKFARNLPENGPKQAGIGMEITVPLSGTIQENRSRRRRSHTKPRSGSFVKSAATSSHSAPLFAQRERRESLFPGSEHSALVTSSLHGSSAHCAINDDSDDDDDEHASFGGDEVDDEDYGESPNRMTFPVRIPKPPVDLPMLQLVRPSLRTHELSSRRLDVSNHSCRSRFDLSNHSCRSRLDLSNHSCRSRLDLSNHSCRSGGLDLSNHSTISIGRPIGIGRRSFLEANSRSEVRRSCVEAANTRPERNSSHHSGRPRLEVSSNHSGSSAVGSLLGDDEDEPTEEPVITISPMPRRRPRLRKLETFS